jgi:lysophospholipase L1-like esterase
LSGGLRRAGPVLGAALVIGAIVGLILGLTSSTSSRAPSARIATRNAAVVGRARGHWVASWTASPEAAGPGTAFDGGFRDQTIRNVIYTSAGGTLARVRLDNTFGTGSLLIGRAAIGVVAHGASLVPGSTMTLTFGGKGSIVVAPGRQVFSDPIHLTVRPLESLAVSVFVPQPTGPPTQHDDAKEANYVVGGDHVLATSQSRSAHPLESWYLVSGLDVWAGGGEHALVALGDSITNGNGTVSGANARWPDDLERRLYARPGGSVLSVVGAGIDGNRVLNPSACCGQSAVARFGRDVLSQAGVREVIVLEGINDIGLGSSNSPLAVPRVNVSAQQIIAGYEQLIARAHAAGLKIFGATLTPFKGSHNWTAAGEAKREAVNAWIRRSGAFDGVINFARAVAKPGDPKRLNPRFDDGDHLHMDDAGYQAMADAVNLAMLLRGLN